MEKKFRALRFVGTVYKVVGIIVGVLTAISAIGFCVFSILGGSLINSIINGLGNTYGGSSAGPAGLFGGILGGVIVGVLILIYGGLISITLYAAGEGIYLAISIEENTRTTAYMLQQQHPQ
jgi:membrane protein DedA with SNARE-associated domain